MTRLTPEEQADYEALLAEEAAARRVRPLDPSTVNSADDLRDADGPALAELRSSDPRAYEAMVSRVGGVADHFESAMMRDLIAGSGGRVFERGAELAAMGPVDLATVVRDGLESGVIPADTLERLTGDQLVEAKRRYPKLLDASLDALSAGKLPGVAQ